MAMRSTESANQTPEDRSLSQAASRAGEARRPAGMRSRLHRLVSAPWQIARLWRALGAWGESDWARIIEVLQPVAERGLDTDGDRLLLGLAHTRLGQWEQAIWYFQQVSGKLLLERERIVHCNTFAYALASAGRLAEAQAHVRRFSRDRWPLRPRKWGDRLLRAESSASEVPVDEVEPPGILH